MPKTLEEARTVSDSREWLAAVNEEIECLQGNKSWAIADVPIGAKMNDSKLVFTLKFKADGAVDKRKARLVAKSFQRGMLRLYMPRLLTSLLLD